MVGFVIKGDGKSRPMTTQSTFSAKQRVWLRSFDIHLQIKFGAKNGHLLINSGG